MESLASAECERVRAMDGDVGDDDVVALLSACVPTLSDCALAENFLATIGEVCERSPSNRMTFGAGRVIPAVFAALSTHGTASASVASKGFVALVWLAMESSVNADAIITSAGGLDVVAALMASHGVDADVQGYASWALWTVARFASPEVLSGIAKELLVELLESAKRSHPEEGYFTVKGYAELALAALSPQAPSPLCVVLPAPEPDFTSDAPALESPAVSAKSTLKPTVTVVPASAQKPRKRTRGPAQPPQPAPPLHKETAKPKSVVQATPRTSAPPAAVQPKPSAQRHRNSTNATPAAKRRTRFSALGVLALLCTIILGFVSLQPSPDASVPEPVPVQTSPNPSALDSKMSALEAAAAAECERVSSMESDISLADGISLLTACTAAWSSPTATVFCFGTITAICLVSETDRETLGAAGAIHAIVTTMSEVTEHGTVNEYITAQGCFALCMLAYDNSVNADDIVLSTGGLDVILSAMTLYPADSVVQVAACSALVYITSVASREALWVIHDSVAVELLKLAKRNHPHEVEGEDSVLYWADKALDILAVKLEAVAFDYCWYVDRMEVVTRDDAIVFVSASTASQSSPAVADCFLDTIARACMFNDVNRATFGAVGAIPAVIWTMVAHGVRNSTIAANGLVALSSLPSKANARNADAIVLSAGGLDAIHSMMVSHPTDEIVQLSACVALGTLAEAVGPKALSVMRKGRTRELLKIAMKKHPKEGRNNVRYWANQALANL